MARSSIALLFLPISGVVCDATCEASSHGCVSDEITMLQAKGITARTVAAHRPDMGVDMGMGSDDDGCELQAYWEFGSCGCGGNDQNAGWCGGIRAGQCPDTIQTSACPSGTAYLATFSGQGGVGATRGASTNWNNDGCEFIWHAQYTCHAPYSFVHHGHCAGGWLNGLNSHQTDVGACSAHCRATSGCKYFAFCDGGACDGNTNCALYNEAAGCPDDNNWGDYEAYVNHYSFVHHGHCAGGWLNGLNSHQTDIGACSAHCRATSGCKYFAFCDGGACDGSTNCALYNEAAGCPDDDNWGDYDAYVNHEAYSFVHHGHCAGGWLNGLNSHQTDVNACSAHCRATSGCKYFAFCDGGACDGSTNCALYTEAAGCPDDDNWGDYDAFVNH